MPYFKILILSIILFFSLFTRGQEQDGSVLENQVTISEENQQLSYILDQLSWQAGVFFSYNASVIDATKKYSIEASNKSLFTVLNRLFDSRKFNFTELDNQIIITHKSNSEAKIKSENDTIPLKYFFLTGKIIDKKKGDPIKYASVSFLNKPLGTITNNDGDFLLKIHPDLILDTVIISCMGFSQITIPAFKILDEDVFEMNPMSIRIKEIEVKAITPSEILKKVRANFNTNYSSETELMNAFYRETVKQDNDYISASEAVLEILKLPYSNLYRNDLIRLLKGRRSPDVQHFRWFNFKLQGGPFTIIKLDIVKTMESFIDPEFENHYSYNISDVIWYNNNPVYVLTFKPVSTIIFPNYVGEIYVNRETFAIVHAYFKFDKSNLKKAEDFMIKSKPRGVKARPTFVEYKVNYQQYNGIWHLANAQASVKFRIRSRRDKINSVYHSISDLLITNVKPTDLKKFARNELFKQHDIFVEMLNNYDENFWGNYNIIEPDEDLRKAFKNKIFSK